MSGVLELLDPCPICEFISLEFVKQTYAMRTLSLFKY